MLTGSLDGRYSSNLGSYTTLSTLGTGAACLGASIFLVISAGCCTWAVGFSTGLFWTGWATAWMF